VYAGRFAPSPTGELHLGNLRTALAAWCCSRAVGDAFRVRMEDLDRVTSSRAHADAQLRDLAALGLDWDPPVPFQSERFRVYDAAIAELTAAGLTYPCYCTRREIREAAEAPHAGPMPDGAYPGTCRDLTAADRARHEHEGRTPAIRLRAGVSEATVDDLVLGRVSAGVDDVVLRRQDGVPAYNLAVVVDDAEFGTELVVRGVDLATSAPRQRHLAELLGLPPVAYAHVGLVLNADGVRLAKRDGAVTLADQAARGRAPDEVRTILACSLGFDPEDANGPAATLPSRFRVGQLTGESWTPPDDLLG